MTTTSPQGGPTEDVHAVEDELEHFVGADDVLATDADGAAAARVTGDRDHLTGREPEPEVDAVAPSSAQK